MQYLIVAVSMLTSSRPNALTTLRPARHQLVRHVAQTVGGLLLLVLMACTFILVQLLVTA